MTTTDDNLKDDARAEMIRQDRADAADLIDLDALEAALGVETALEVHGLMEQIAELRMGLYGMVLAVHGLAEGEQAEPELLETIATRWNEHWGNYYDFEPKWARRRMDEMPPPEMLPWPMEDVH